MTVIPFWKNVGGYTFVLKWRGRWHYGGRTASEYLTVVQWLTDHGYRLQRVCTPKAVNDAYRLHGATFGCLKNHLPHFTTHTQEKGD